MINRQFKKMMVILIILTSSMFLFTIYTFSKNDIIDSISFLIFTLLFVGITLIYYIKYKNTKQPSQNIVQDNIYYYQNFVIQREVGFKNQLLIYSVEGKFLGRFKRCNGAIISILLGNKILVPGAYELVDANGEEVCLIKVEGLIQPRILIYKFDEKIAEINQKIFKSAFSYVYEINFNNNNFIVKSEVLTNDLYLEEVFRLSEKKVPLENSIVFQELTMNTYEIMNSLETNKGKLGLVIMCIHSLTSGR
ncbi:hypothetical protein [Macrococcoides canis]|uniref:hypothetical protein n=1 Tax=Macrococcoides canis TaxID=1855823 RepID=UPI001B8D9A9B|nr:hypothetical protein [Macrococcus canis]QUR94928.1 hypothetical protein GOY09_08170 [Macrococcus canis]UTH06557.1 hypothetical protein KFV07_10485 [Macrococcus canis]